MSDRVWRSNTIQFPRLLAEIWSVGLTPAQYAELQTSMDLTRDEIDELFERADVVWQARKDKTR